MRRAAACFHTYLELQDRQLLQQLLVSKAAHHQPSCHSCSAACQHLVYEQELKHIPAIAASYILTVNAYGWQHFTVLTAAGAAHGLQHMACCTSTPCAPTGTRQLACRAFAEALEGGKQAVCWVTCAGRHTRPNPQGPHSGGILRNCWWKVLRMMHSATGKQMSSSISRDWLHSALRFN